MLVAQLDSSDNITALADLVDMFPDETFPAAGPDADWMTAHNLVFVLDNPPYNIVTQSLESSDYYVLTVNGVKAVYSYAVYDLTQDQIDYQLQQLIVQFATNRNSFVNRCNWTMLPDAPLTDAEKTAWTAYRLGVRQAFEDYRGSDRTMVPQWPTPPQDLDNYILEQLTPAHPGTPPSATGNAPPPPPPAPPPPTNGPLVMSPGVI